MRPHAATAAVLAGVLALAGCGLEDPYAEKQRESGQPEHTLGSDAKPPADRRDPGNYVTGGSETRDADTADLAAAYGMAAGNWSWRTYRRQYERMLARAGGALRRELLSTPPDADVLASLQDSEQTNRAELVATDAHGAGEVIVVMRELAGAGGRLDLSPVHIVYRAGVGPTPVGPRVTAWERLP